MRAMNIPFTEQCETVCISETQWSGKNQWYVVIIKLREWCIGKGIAWYISEFIEPENINTWTRPASINY